MLDQHGVSRMAARRGFTPMDPTRPTDEEDDEEDDEIESVVVGSKRPRAHSPHARRSYKKCPPLRLFYLLWAHPCRILSGRSNSNKVSQDPWFDM